MYDFSFILILFEPKFFILIIEKIVCVVFYAFPPNKYMIVEYLWNIPMRYSQHIWKKLRMNFRRIFRNNVPGILNTGIFPDFIMNILRMLQMSCIFLGGSRNTLAVFYSERQFLIFTWFLRKSNIFMEV